MPLVLLHRCSTTFLVGFEDLAEILGVEASGEFRGSGKVTEPPSELSALDVSVNWPVQPSRHWWQRSKLKECEKQHAREHFFTAALFA
jgi:hypothetical protein